MCAVLLVAKSTVVFCACGAVEVDCESFLSEQ